MIRTKMFVFNLWQICRCLLPNRTKQISIFRAVLSSFYSLCCVLLRIRVRERQSRHNPVFLQIQSMKWQACIEQEENHLRTRTYHPNNPYNQDLDVTAVTTVQYAMRIAIINKSDSLHLRLHNSLNRYLRQTGIEGIIQTSFGGSLTLTLQTQW